MEETELFYQIEFRDTERNNEKVFLEYVPACDVVSIAQFYEEKGCPCIITEVKKTTTTNTVSLEYLKSKTSQSIARYSNLRVGNEAHRVKARTVTG